MQQWWWFNVAIIALVVLVVVVLAAEARRRVARVTAPGRAARRPTRGRSTPATADPPGNLRPAERQLVRLALMVRRYARDLNPVGSVGALLFFIGSMTPSLLPRVWYLQGVATGICTILGYAAGATLAAVFRWLGVHPRWTPVTRRWARRILTIVAALAVPTFLLAGARWQAQIRTLVGVSQTGYVSAGVFLVSLPAAVLLLTIARLVRRMARAIGRWAARFIPVRMARTLADVLIAAVLIFMLNGLIYRPFLAIANQSASTVNHGTAAGVIRPDTPDRSGSPDSAVPWDSLGEEGRKFVASGPTPAQLEAFSHRTAQMPIRVYAGLASADGIRAEADLVVEELRRTGAFNRAVLAVATTTGTGWVDEDMAVPLEYLNNGDTAIASMQYSYLPSSVAFIADRSTPREAGRELFDRVYQVWVTMPAAHRPKLVIFGESLGSFGAEAPFSGPQDLAARTDGALFVGPPNFSPLWQQLEQNRDPGSPEILPVVDGGKNVRFSATGTDLAADDKTWASPRTVYLQHATDPVVWWSPSLLFTRPDWLKEPHSPEVSPDMRWMPLVTFWQVTTDLAFAADTPPTFGHHYGTGTADAWAAIVHPAGWTAADTARLRQLMDQDH